MENIYGIIGYPVKNSFSKKYFTEKFEKEGIEESEYRLFELKHIEQLPDFIKKHPNIRGFNVTSPHKQTIIPYLDRLEKEAEAIGAVNCVRVKDGVLIGRNADEYGFEVSLRNFLGAQRPKALVLGSGGAAKAVEYVLKKMKIDYLVVSRGAEKSIRYEQITKSIMQEYKLVINATPLGMAHAPEECPPLPYELFTSQHIAYDLIYNPTVTRFLALASERGAKTYNGERMLIEQAERSWELWNE